MNIPVETPRKHAMHNMSSAGFWMECDLWYSRKKAAIESGTLVDRSSAASDRGTLLHDLAEAGIRAFMETQAVDMSRQWVKTRNLGLAEDDEEQLIRAMEAAIALITSCNQPTVMLEVGVPLSHEPGSKGFVDLVIFDDEKLLIPDYKFGQGRVDPWSPQLMGYGANVVRRLRQKGIQIPQRIFLGVIQPRHHREALLHEVTESELDTFRLRVERKVTDQILGKARDGARKLSTCEWCDFATGCPARNELVVGMMDDMTVAASGELDAELVERIVESRSAIEKVIKQCVEIVVGDPETFPNWKRVEVRNARKWDLETQSEFEVACILDGKGIDPWVLASPAKIVERAPGAAELVEFMTVDMGHHVRLTRLKAKEGEEGKAAARRPPPPSFVSRVEAAMKPAAKAESEPQAPPVEEPKPKKPAKKPKNGKSTTLDKAKEEVLANAKASVRKLKATNKKERSENG